MKNFPSVKPNFYTKLNKNALQIHNTQLVARLKHNLFHFFNLSNMQILLQCARKSFVILCMHRKEKLHFSRHCVERRLNIHRDIYIRRRGSIVVRPLI